MCIFGLGLGLVLEIWIVNYHNRQPFQYWQDPSYMYALNDGRFILRHGAFGAPILPGGVPPVRMTKIVSIPFWSIAGVLAAAAGVSTYFLVKDIRRTANRRVGFSVL